MGIEDAAILGGLLERFPSKDTLPTALRLYEQLRIKRTAMVARASFDSRWFTQMEDGSEQFWRSSGISRTTNPFENPAGIVKSLISCHTKSSSPGGRTGSFTPD